MQHGAGQVEDRAQVGARRGVGAAADGGKQRGFIGQRQAMLDALAGSGQFGTDAAGDQLAAVGFDQGGELLQDAVNRGKALVWVHGSRPDRAERSGSENR